MLSTSLFGSLVLGCVTTAQNSSKESIQPISTKVVDEKSLNDLPLEYDPDGLSLYKNDGFFSFGENSFLQFLNIEENGFLIQDDQTLSKPDNLQKYDIIPKNIQHEESSENLYALNIPETSIILENPAKDEKEQKNLQTALEKKTVTKFTSQKDPKSNTLTKDVAIVPSGKNQITEKPLQETGKEGSKILSPEEESKSLRQKSPPLSQFTVSAFVNEKIPIKLEGEGWSLNKNFDVSLKLLQKEYSPTNQTIFYIQASNIGEYVLRFSRLAIGTVEEQIVLLKINPHNSPISIKNLTTQHTSSDKIKKIDPENTLPKDKNTKISPQIDNKFTPKSNINQKNKKSPSPLFQQNTTSDNKTTPQLKSPKSSSTSSTLEEIEILDKDSLKVLFNASLKKQQTQKDQERTLEIGKTFIRRFPKDNTSAEILYQLGQLLEKQTPSMNRKLAHSYYQKAYQNYPLSPYSRLSKERILHLEQFYLRLP